MEGLGALGRLGSNDLLLYSCILTNCLVDRFTAWRVAERFYDEYFGFLFDNIWMCYLVFAFFFLTLLAFILLLCFDEYGLE